ncbi:uncharacterized protein FIBRA_04623 [Fibroporia radiculosa]|uniref:Uncharacterized protein n=1 Tax=Fibroporia radiculosa TaxID=599839 RepID=J4IA95_9APHY|nr:uncharacterized protein FIBRA_04623 [Fibroporia radiculosa]CCM02521.1 predicted protein [Fibroporia radiculosa]
MGRPLFSQTHRAPAVRIEPEQSLPACEKWSYWNAFDPDSDEFFERGDAVYEAFVDPAHASAEIGAQIALAPPTLIDVSTSSSSSEGSSSGRQSPADDREDLSVEEIDLALRSRGGWVQRSRAADDEEGSPNTTQTTSDYSRLESPRTPVDAMDVMQRRWASHMADSYTRNRTASSASPRPVGQRALSPTSPDESPRVSRQTDMLEPVRQVLPLTFPHTIPGIPRSRGMPAPQPSTPDRPTTPPSRFAGFYQSPSPPPSVTPRLYSWSARSPMLSTPTSPVPPGPLTNRNARLSVPHISPPPPPVLMNRVVG